jgi:hypothetical protein
MHVHPDYRRRARAEITVPVLQGPWKQPLSLALSGRSAFHLQSLKQKPQFQMRGIDSFDFPF